MEECRIELIKYVSITACDSRYTDRLLVGMDLELRPSHLAVLEGDDRYQGIDIPEEPVLHNR